MEDEIESGNRIGLSSRAERLGEIGTFFGDTYFLIYRKSSNRSPCPVIGPPMGVSKNISPGLLLELLRYRHL